jgi:hypothetical protein
MSTVTHDPAVGIALLLVCDRCANVLRAKDMPAKGFETVWRAAVDIGWVGPEHAEGPHYCPACADAAERAPRPGHGPRAQL